MAWPRIHPSSRVALRFPTYQHTLIYITPSPSARTARILPVGMADTPPERRRACKTHTNNRRCDNCRSLQFAYQFFAGAKVLAKVIGIGFALQRLGQTAQKPSESLWTNERPPGWATGPDSRRSHPAGQKRRKSERLAPSPTEDTLGRIEDTGCADAHENPSAAFGMASAIRTARPAARRGGPIGKQGASAGSLNTGHPQSAIDNRIPSTTRSGRTLRPIAFSLEKQP